MSGYKDGTRSSIGFDEERFDRMCEEAERRHKPLDDRRNFLLLLMIICVPLYAVLCALL